MTDTLTFAPIMARTVEPLGEVNAIPPLRIAHDLRVFGPANGGPEAFYALLQQAHEERGLSRSGLVRVGNRWVLVHPSARVRYRDKRQQHHES